MARNRISDAGTPEVPNGSQESNGTMPTTGHSDNHESISSGTLGSTRGGGPDGLDYPSDDRANASPLSTLAALRKSLENRPAFYGDPDDPIRKRFPGLWEFLCSAKTDEGLERAPGSIKLSPCHQGWKVTCEDSTWGWKFAFNIDSYDDAKAEAERILQSGRIPWARMTWGDGHDAMEKAKLKAEQKVRDDKKVK